MVQCYSLLVMLLHVVRERQQRGLQRREQRLHAAARLGASARAPPALALLAALAVAAVALQHEQRVVSVSVSVCG